MRWDGESSFLVHHSLLLCYENVRQGIKEGNKQNEWSLFFCFFFLLLVELDGMSFNGCVIHIFVLSLVMRILCVIFFSSSSNSKFKQWCSQQQTFYVRVHVFIYIRNRAFLQDLEWWNFWNVMESAKYLFRFIEQFKNFIGEYSNPLIWFIDDVYYVYGGIITTLRHINNLIYMWIYRIGLGCLEMYALKMNSCVRVL